MILYSTLHFEPNPILVIVLHSNNNYLGRIIRNVQDFFFFFGNSAKLIVVCIRFLFYYPKV
jgi:hypothetical protein